MGATGKHHHSQLPPCTGLTDQRVSLPEEEVPPRHRVQKVTGIYQADVAVLVGELEVITSLVKSLILTQECCTRGLPRSV